MRATLFSILLVSASVLTGCGKSSGLDRGPLGTLSGVVMSADGLLTEGTIYLQHEKGAGAGGGGAEIQPDGTFNVTGGKAGGIPVGTYTVWFSPPQVEVSTPTEPSSLVDKEMPDLPEKYRAQATSGLTVEITAGENMQDFNVTP